MARKLQTPDMEIFVPCCEMNHMVVVCCQEVKNREKFLERLDDHLNLKGFQCVKMTYMWEMFITLYIKKDEVKTGIKRCGFGNMVGNKGGMNITIKFAGRVMTFIGCHLVHGQANRFKRDQMMEDIMKYPSFRHFKPEIDQDMVSDYTFILGDLNYRFDSNYEDMIRTGLINFAHEKIEDLDQLHKSMKGIEPPPETLPEG
jgi:hypothetical protein